MKSKILKIKAFATFLVIIVLLSAFNLREKEDKTFLETYKGTLWKYGEIKDGLKIYAQINRSESQPLEIWLYDVMEDCYFYEKYSESVSTEIVENKKNRVQIKIKESSNEYGIFTLTIHNDELTVELDTFKDDQLVKEEQFNLKKSSDRMDLMTVCKN